MKRYLVIMVMLLSACLSFGQALVDPCATNTAKSSVVINVNAAATTQLVALATGKTVFVCSFMFTAATGTAATYQFEYGTGASCGTGTTVLTGAMIGNNSPIMDTSSMTSFQTITSNALCLVTGGTTPSAQGYLTFIQQ